ncbi:MAG: response regulator [Sedimentisphaerales bacterium]|nr:response regulator [Sedimentisphaerales bacterium]
MRALVIDDRDTNRLLLLKFLAPWMEGDAAADGEDGVEVFEEALQQGKPYKLVCLDVMMPGMDGHETLLKIRQIEKDARIPPQDHAKILMTTAVDSPNSINEAVRLGADGYLVKPVRKTNLIEELEKLDLIPADDLSVQL